MPTYVARARDARGNPSRRRVVAKSPRDVRLNLQKQGLFILDIQEAQPYRLSGELDLGFLTKISVKDKAIFSRQFAALVNAGVAMVRSLGVMAEQASNSKLKKILLEVNSDVQQGSTLSEAMRSHPEAFDKLYVSMIQAGEAGGGFR